MQRFSIIALIAVSVLLPAAKSSMTIAERGSGRIALTCPTGEGCTNIPNPPQSGPKPEGAVLMAAFVPDPTDPPKGNPEGSGTR